MESGKKLQTAVESPGALSPIEALADIPEEEIWLAKQKSARTRRAYKLDVQHFMRTLHIKSYDELRQVDHRAVTGSPGPGAFAAGRETSSAACGSFTMNESQQTPLPSTATVASSIAGTVCARAAPPRSSAPASMVMNTANLMSYLIAGASGNGSQGFSSP
jgi:hypothetical protein